MKAVMTTQEMRDTLGIFELPRGFFKKNGQEIPAGRYYVYQVRDGWMSIAREGNKFCAGSVNYSVADNGDVELFNRYPQDELDMDAVNAELITFESGDELFLLKTRIAELEQQLKEKHPAPKAPKAKAKMAPSAAQRITFKESKWVIDEAMSRAIAPSGKMWKLLEKSNDGWRVESKGKTQGIITKEGKYRNA